MQTISNFRQIHLAGLLMLVLPLLSDSRRPAGSDLDGWELKKRKDGIDVYIREQEGSAIKELKFSTTLQASLQAIGALLTDVEGYNDWVYASLVSRTIDRVSETEVYYYAELDFPWPFENRDLVLYSRFWQDPKTYAIHSQTWSRHWMLPEKENIVRIKDANFSWTFRPGRDGAVQVDYYLQSDPGGNIPAWMVNLAADQGPFESMLRFRELLGLDRYRERRLPFVRDFPPGTP
ncbi:MAG: hypothetical protein RLY31_2457 [Bacteroidota bacterium]|jgi:hypothetical protein